MWLRCLGAFLVALGVMFAAPFRFESTPLAQTEGAPPGGELLYAHDGGIWRFSLATNETSRLLQGSGGLISHIAYSPDYSRLAYAVTTYDRTFSVRSSDIIVCDADGSNSRAVVHETEPGYFVGWVTWPSDPSRLVYGKVNWGRGFVERIEDVLLDTGERRLIMESGSAPSASPSSPTLAYQTRAGARWNLWKLDRATRERAELIPADWFDDADRPTFSPDGATIAFVAAGAGPPPPATPDPLADLLGLGRLRIAGAHDLFGALFDLWTIQPTGENPRRVTALFDQQPEIAWSPSGRFIVARGSLQLQIIDVATGVTRALPRPPGSSGFGGPIAWGPARVPDGR